MAYQAFRENGAPTFYEENHTPWKADILEAGLIFAFSILAASFYIILPGIRGKEKLYTFIRVTVSLYIGSVIVLTNFSYTWETAEIHTRTKYKAGTGHDISADVGVHIGLRGINITLKGTPEQQLNETINYNEHFSWEWTQGRLGFGPFAGRFNQEYRAAQFRGLPLPILWIAEYFTFDGEGIRWGRHYRQAGWYSHILLWACFPLWLLTNILFFVLLKYGAYFLILTGACMVTSNIIWATIRNVNELQIPFEEGLMTFSFGGSFYVCLITGIMCMLLGIAVCLVDIFFPNAATSFFGVDVLQDDDEATGTEGDDEVPTKRPVDDMEMGDMIPTTIAPPVPTGKKPVIPKITAATPEEDDDDEQDIYEYPEQKHGRYQRRSRATGLTKMLQKSRRHRPPPPPPQDIDDLYANERYDVGAGDVRLHVS